MVADGPYIQRSLYPPIDAWAVDYLEVGDGHQIYVEQSGNPGGIPVVFVHGGPGGGTSPIQRRFFDPSRYHIILFDQRGCGKSMPHASLSENTTWDLVADMEYIREFLSLDAWLLFGGSWGSTLALLYAQKYPQRSLGLILRGIFLMQQRELDWFYGHGTSTIFPEAWQRFILALPEEERHQPIDAYYRRLTETQYQDVRLEFAKEWSLWEGSTVTLIPDDAQHLHTMDPSFALAFARIETHYFYHGGFLEQDDQILRDAAKLVDIPTTIVQGRYDAICPPRSAWELSKALPWADLRMVPVAGHSAFEPAIRHELITATDAFVPSVKSSP